MEKLLTKLIADTISEEELIELHRLLEDPKHQEELKAFVEDYHDLNLAMLKNNVEEAYSKVVAHIEKQDRPTLVRLRPSWLKYAAAAIILFGLGYFYLQNVSTTNNVPTLIPKEESITLELDNGVIETLDMSQTKEVKDSEGNVVGNQREDELTYGGESASRRLVFNTLRIPYGKQFQLVLSDGTKVHLNAGTMLRYPVTFSEEGQRNVYLQGEAYFDVTEDKERPFIVNAGDSEIKVLGTEFNVSSYTEDPTTDVILVEGSVRVTPEASSQSAGSTLLPGQKGSVDYKSKQIVISDVNTNIYTAWVQGHLVFRNMNFDNIVRKLERHYNVDIENTNSELGTEIFDASFNKIKIDSVLSFFNDTHKIDFEIKNNTVYIK
nr:FecR family protein [Allomuricauda sp.]